MDKVTIQQLDNLVFADDAIIHHTCKVRISNDSDTVHTIHLAIGMGGEIVGRPLRGAIRDATIKWQNANRKGGEEHLSKLSSMPCVSVAYSDLGRVVQPPAAIVAKTSREGALALYQAILEKYPEAADLL